MRVDLRSLVKETGAERHLPLDFTLSPQTGVTVDGAVSGELAIRNTGRQVVAMGSVSATVVVECSRCLADAAVAVQADLEAVCAVSRIRRQIAGLHVDPDPESDALFWEGNLNVAEMVRQALLTALPLKPLCTTACRGLCPGCGVNLNVETCTCPTEDVDPRLAALQVLLQNRQQD